MSSKLNFAKLVRSRRVYIWLSSKMILSSFLLEAFLVISRPFWVFLVIYLIQWSLNQKSTIIKQNHPWSHDQKWFNSILQTLGLSCFCDFLVIKDRPRSRVLFFYSKNIAFWVVLVKYNFRNSLYRMGFFGVPLFRSGSIWIWLMMSQKTDITLPWGLLSDFNRRTLLLIIRHE